MPDRAVARTARGVAAAVGARPLTVMAIAAVVLALHALLPPLVLSLVRTPWTFFTFNPWLKRVPAYLASAIPLEQKLDFLSRVAVFWFSADGPYGAPEWGFAVDAADLGRFAVMSALVAVYFALWLRARDVLTWEVSHGPAKPPSIISPLGSPSEHGSPRTATAARAAPAMPWRPSTYTHRAGGVAGALVSVLGLSTGPCSVVGCGAPVLPVVALAFAGLSSGTVTMLSSLSRAAGAVTLVALLIGVVYLGWRVGPRPSRGPTRFALNPRSE